MALKPGYKQTEIGVIPEDWNVRSLDNIFTLKNGFAFSSEHFSDSGPVVLTPGNFRLEGGLYFENRNTTRYSGSYSSAMRLSKGDLLIVMTDLTPDCNLLGRPAFVETDEIILHNQRIGKVQLKEKSVNGKLLFYALLSQPYLTRVKEQATGSTVRHTSNKSIYRVELAWPPPQEQRAIAEALSDVDALIGSLDRLIAKKRDLKQAAMQQLLTAQTRLPGFQGEWPVRPLRDVCTKIQDGTHFSPKLGGNDFLYVTSKNIGFGTFDVSKADRINGEEHAKIYARCDVKKGDLLLTKDGANTGNCALNPLDEPFSLLSSVALLRFDARQHVAAFFLYQILSDQGQRQITDLMSGNAITRLTLAKIRALRFAVASREEQAAVAEVLSDMDAELAALEQRREKTRVLKQGMMQELLTGRIRLV